MKFQLVFRVIFLGPAFFINTLLSDIQPLQRSLSNPNITNVFNASVLISDDPKLGVILTDTRGMTLYTFIQDRESVSNCKKECLITWPPLLTLSEQTIAPPGLRGSLTVTRRSEGTLQLTYNGKPLYRYIKDIRPGDAFGQGIDGQWFVVNPDSSSRPAKYNN